MKTRIITILLAAMLMLAVFAPCAVFAKDVQGGTDIPETPEPVTWAHNWPTKLLTFRDAEHKEPIEDEWKPGEKIYYALDCEEGRFSTGLYISDAEYIDGGYFILGYENEMHPRTISISSYLAGDIDNSGSLNAKDVTILMKRLVGDTPTFWETYGNPLLDFNRDTKINARDVLAMMKQLVTGKSIHGGVQSGITGVRDAAVKGTALFGAGNKHDVWTDDGRTYHYGNTIFYNKEYKRNPYGYYAVIKDKAELETELEGWAEPVTSENEFIPDEKKWIASPSEYLASVTDDTFADSTLLLVSLADNAEAVKFDGAYYVNETLVPCISVYEGHPGIDCDGYSEHFMIITFDKLPEDQPIAPRVNNYYPL